MTFRVSLAVICDAARQGSEAIKALVAKEQRRQKKVFRSLRLKDNSLRRMHITTKCLSGFELYQDVICGQCRPDLFFKK